MKIFKLQNFRFQHIEMSRLQQSKEAKINNSRHFVSHHHFKKRTSKPLRGIKSSFQNVFTCQNRFRNARVAAKLVKK
jgi:hypothetical protein